MVGVGGRGKGGWWEWLMFQFFSKLASLTGGF